MIFNLFLIFAILFLLFFLSMIWPPDSPWAPWWRTDSSVAERICRLANVKRGEVVYELGSGDAQTLIAAAKTFNAKGVGIEIDPLRVFISKFFLRIKGLTKDVRIIRGNFFEEDLSKADVIFVYLVPKTLDKLLPKFRKELKKGTRIVSYRYKMKLKEVKVDKELQLYLYTI